MNDYIIITDSTGDFTPALCEELGIQVIPMEFMLDDVSYRNYPDERDLSGKEFYDKLRMGSNATTAQVNMATYCDVARPYLQAGKDVLFLVFSSGLSGSYNSCTLAVEDLKAEFADREIVAVDTRAASMGEGLLVYYAAQQQKAGKTLAEVADWVTENRGHLCHWFTVDDLHFLHRGGRVSAASAVVGSMLSIKPVLHVDDEGHLIPMEKVRGRRQSLDALLKHLDETIWVGKSPVVFLSHGDAPEDAAYVEEQLRGKYGIERIVTNLIGPVIGCHSGPGTVALFWLGEHK